MLQELILLIFFLQSFKKVFSLQLQHEGTNQNLDFILF